VNLKPPTDALPEQRQLLAYRPSFVVRFDAPTKLSGRYYLTWTLRNVGAGIARKVRVFLPGIMTDALEQPLEPKEQVQRRTRYEDKQAFLGLMKPPIQLIVEFEDYAGNLYRQYGFVYQPTVEGAEYNGYAVEELDRPYLVADRIVGTERTAEAFDVLPDVVDDATAHVTRRGPLVGRIPFEKLAEAGEAAEEAGEDTFAAKTFRELPESKTLRQQTFELVTAVRKCLIRYHGDLEIDSFVSPEISHVYTKWLLAVKNKIETFVGRRVLREQSKLPITVTRLAMFLDDIEQAASRVDRDIQPLLRP
jgi:hypothetical protein